MGSVGIDLGGTKIEGVLLGEESEVLQRRRIPTGSQDGYEAILARVVGMIRELIQKGGQTVGLGAPGSVSPDSGRVRNSNTQCLNGQPLKEDLEQLLELEVAIDNDANCFALAESREGRGAGYGTMFGVILGTGVGGGVILDGQIHRGRHHIAGEWGHHILHPSGNACYCGRKGCVETYLCGPALERRWREMTGKIRPLSEIVRTCGASPVGEPERAWKDEFLENFSIALSNVINILDPDVVVLGGGVSNVPFLYSEGATRVQERIFGSPGSTPILKNKLGDSAGVLGAAWLGGGLRV